MSIHIDQQNAHCTSVAVVPEGAIVAFVSMGIRIVFLIIFVAYLLVFGNSVVRRADLIGYCEFLFGKNLSLASQRTRNNLTKKYSPTASQGFICFICFIRLIGQLNILPLTSHPPPSKTIKDRGAITDYTKSTKYSHLITQYALRCKDRKKEIKIIFKKRTSNVHFIVYNLHILAIQLATKAKMRISIYGESR